MNVKEYQEFCKQNWAPGCHDSVHYFVLGLAGETGEVCEEFKKAARDRRTINMDNLTKELGDVMWYIANICNSFNLSLEQVLEQNRMKLEERHGGTYKSYDKNVLYRLNGPHIEMIDKTTGGHLRFCKKEEVPKEVLERLKAAATKIEDGDMPWRD